MQEEQPHLVEKISKIERLKVRTQYFAIQLALLIGVWLLVSFVLDVSWGPLNEFAARGGNMTAREEAGAMEGEMAAYSASKRL